MSCCVRFRQADLCFPNLLLPTRPGMDMPPKSPASLLRPLSGTHPPTHPPPGCPALHPRLPSVDCLGTHTGTKSLKYLEENVGALGVRLTPQEMEELEQAVPQDQVGPLPCLPA